jgi:hypothetical protein
MTSSIMKTAIIAGSLLLALAGRAAAQPGMSEPALDPALDPALEPAPLPPPANAPLPPLGHAPSGEQLSESTALALSLGGTLGSWGLLIGAPFVSYYGDDDAAVVMGVAGGLGVVLAPSFGRWYAGQFFTRGLGLRVAGAGLTLVGASAAVAGGISIGHDDTPEDDKGAGFGPVLLLAGLGMFVWGTAEDIARAPGAVRRKNHERAGAGTSIAFAPLVTQQSAGFTLGGRF